MAESTFFDLKNCYFPDDYSDYLNVTKFYQSKYVLIIIHPACNDIETILAS